MMRSASPGSRSISIHPIRPIRPSHPRAHAGACLFAGVLLALAASAGCTDGLAGSDAAVVDLAPAPDLVVLDLTAPPDLKAPTCTDGVRNQDETDVDCGGRCPGCAEGKTCNAGPDCTTGVCTAGRCAAPACTDGVKNGPETDVDCGGTCSPCVDGKACAAGSDCANRICTGGKCVPGACTDGTKNGQETDVDCGGPVCSTCGDGMVCVKGTDCAAGVCTAGRCAAAACTDGVKNGPETDVDCGGSCPTCGDGKVCGRAADCASGVCTAGKCVAPTCTDGIKNGGESDIDCGGNCGKCGEGKACGAPIDCASGSCSAGKCAAPSCTDQVKNGPETDVDCGGSCPACGDGKACALAADCASKICTGSKCAAASCSDGVQNGNETGIDCGGGACNPCSIGSGGAMNPNTVATPVGMQIRVNISAVAGQGDFAVNQGATELPFCFEQPSGECAAAPATKIIWVKLAAAVPAGARLDLTLPRAGSPRAVDGDKVFDFYESFNGTFSGWSKEATPVTATQVADGEKGLYLTFPSGQYAGNEVWHSMTTLPAAHTIEAHIKDINTSYNYPGGLLIVFQDRDNWLGLEGQYESSWTERGESSGGDSNWLHNYRPNIFPNGWQTQRVDVTGDGSYRVWVDGGLRAKYPIPAPWVNQGMNGLGVVKHGSSGDMLLNWIRARRYLDKEITVVITASGCADGVKNNAETDVDCGGPACAPCAASKACNANNDCQSRSCAAATCAAPASCKAIRDGSPNATDGVYTIDPDGAGPAVALQTFCDMTTAGGGWTLIGHLYNDAGDGQTSLGKPTPDFFIRDGSYSNDWSQSWSFRKPGAFTYTEVRLTHYNGLRAVNYDASVAFAQDLYDLGNNQGYAATVKYVDKHPYLAVGATVYLRAADANSADTYSGVAFAAGGGAYRHAIIEEASRYNQMIVGSSPSYPIARKNDGSGSNNSNQWDSTYGRIWVR